MKYHGKIYRYFVCWLRDHVHTLKGMKYFYPDIKSAIELYRDSQRKDGMIWDNVYSRTAEPNYWDQIFSYADFVRGVPEDEMEFKRIPVENDVEYLFIEGIYYTWKACADDAWMAAMLDRAMKAFDYSQRDPYRWSRKYKLLKRGFTIDTWDFQSEEDTARTGHTMVIDLKKTHFGIMHGDNTGFAIGCEYLAEMLEHVGRAKEAAKYRKLAGEIRSRLDKLAWNGRFYTHHVPEDPSVKRDLGVDLSEQISLSNSYALNRRIAPKQCNAIIRSYQQIREYLPPGSPGEWYAIFPPFPKAFIGHGMWEYMNGGVLSIVAGELARGAFQNGFEEYGVDILKRVAELARMKKGYLDCCFRGSNPEAPPRKFSQVDISAQANADFCGAGAPGVPGWSGQGDNDLHEMPTGQQILADIPFNVIDPANNGRKACIGLCSAAETSAAQERAREGYLSSTTIPIGHKSVAIYFLHAAASGSGLCGSLKLEYADGTTFTKLVNTGSELQGWWFPPAKPPQGGAPKFALAWAGKNKKCGQVGVYAYGMDNPHPEKVISNLVLEASTTGVRWFVLGVTLCDTKTFFPPSRVSYGIPDNWGAAAVVYALIEGLAGVVDKGTGFDRVTLSPRWPAAGVQRVAATVKYPASGGYVRYRYAHDSKKRTLNLLVSGTAERMQMELLMPNGKAPAGVAVDGARVPFKTRRVAKSVYACFETRGVGAHQVAMKLARR
jgi:hypothetical protein